MLNSQLLHKIGLCRFTPMWLKMWCLRGIFKNIQKHIEQLPENQRSKFDAVAAKHGNMRA